GVQTWNTVSNFPAYLVFVITLASLHRALAETQARVDLRTAELRRELAEKKKLEVEIVAVAEDERQRVARELHDNLSQHLTGTSLLAQGVADKLGRTDEAAAREAGKIVDLINRRIELTVVVA